MIRSQRHVLCTSVLLALVATGGAWLSIRPVATVDSSGTVRSTVSRRLDPIRDEGDALMAAREATRQEVQATVLLGGRPGSERAAPLPERVRVHGQVRRSGRPVADYDLSFESVGLRSNEDDWDSTDEDGRYEVEVRADHYVVRNEAAGPWVTGVTVPAGAREIVVDIDLPREHAARE